MDAVFLIVLILLIPLCFSAVFLRVRLAERISADRRPPVGYSARDMFLTLSPLAAFLGLMVLCFIEPVRHLLIRLASASLALLCDGSFPLMFCWPIRSMGWFLAAIFVSHLVFVLGSVLFVRRIIFGNYDKPKNYDARPMSGEAALGYAIVWLFILWGGYLFGKLAAPLGPPIGVMCARQICLWMRFRKSPRPGSGSNEDGTGARRSQ